MYEVLKMIDQIEHLHRTEISLIGHMFDKISKIHHLNQLKKKSTQP